MSASMGYGPGLPTTGLAAAVMLDRIRANLRNGAAAFRAHPLLLVPPLIILLSATFTYIMTAAVTITIHSPRAPGLFPPLNLVPGAHRTLPSAQAGEPGGSGGRGLTPGNSRGGKPSKSPGRSRSPSPSDSTTAPPRSSSPSPPASTPPGTVSPSPSPSPSPSWPCVEVGILGICLKL